MHPLEYARRSTPAHQRVGALVADASELGWAFSLMRDMPEADVFLVGGSVRDAITGRRPHEWHTLVRDVTPARLTRWLSAQGRVERVNDGVWQFTPTNAPTCVEIALPRVRVPNADMRRADFFADHKLRIEDDLASRDFSVNAMAYSLRDGRLTDPHGGLHDLTRYREIRPIRNAHDHFGQEPNSLMRALRIAADVGLQIEKNTWHAIQAHGHRLNHVVHDSDGKATHAVPRHHLGREFLLGLRSNGSYFLKLVHDSGLLHHSVPELRQLTDIRHTDQESGWQKTEKLISVLESERHRKLYGIIIPSAALLVAALVYFFEDASQDQLRSLISRLHLHRAKDARLDFDHHHAFWLLEKARELETSNHDKMPLSRLERLLHGQQGAELLALLHAAHIASGSHSVARERLNEMRTRRETLLTRFTMPKLLKGRDIVALGLTPGHHVRAILDKVRDAQLSGVLTSRRAALDFARYLVCHGDVC